MSAIDFRKMIKISKRLGRVGMKTFKALGGMVMRFGKALVVGVVGGFAVAIRKGMQFQDAMANLKAITNPTAESLAFVRKEAIRLSKKFGLSAASMAEGLTVIGSLNSELVKSPELWGKFTENIGMLVSED